MGAPFNEGGRREGARSSPQLAPPAPMASMGAPFNEGGRKANGEHPTGGRTTLSGSANHRVPAWRPPTLRVAPGLAPGAGGRGRDDAPSPPPSANGEHGRTIQRGRAPGAGRGHEAPPSRPPPGANGEHGRYIQRGRAPGQWRAPNRWWSMRADKGLAGKPSVCDSMAV